MIRCLHCGAETSNGLALCDLCRRAALTYLEFLPVYFRNLARWRPGRAGSRPVPGSRVLYDGGPSRLDGTGDRISDRLDEAMTMATTRARMLVDDRPGFTRPLTLSDAVLCDDLPQSMADELNDNPAAAMAALCAGFEEHLTSISTLDWCGEFVRDLAHHESVLRGLTERFVPGWYAGGCRQVIGFDEEGAAVRCESGTYVVPGLSWVTCSACGTTTYARDHLDVILDEASTWVARPKALAEAVVALVDTEQSPTKVIQRIRWWAHKGWLTPIHRTERGYGWDADTESVKVIDQQVGHARYRFGDVLDQVLRDTRNPARTTKATRVS